MKRDYLLPSRFRLWGWVLLVPSVALGLCLMCNWRLRFDWLDELSVIGLTVALLFIGFARCGQEDECVAALRLKALTLAVLAEYMVLVVGTLACYELAYLDFVAYNLFTVLVAFILLFYGLVWLWRKGRIVVSRRMWLLPPVCRRIGWVLAVPFAVVCLCVLFSQDFGLSWLDEAGVVGLTVALLLISFSREWHEDEYIATLRSKAWVWAVYVSYIILIMGTVSIYGEVYLTFLFCNLFTVPVVFILKFRWMMYKLSKEGGHHDK